MHQFRAHKNYQSPSLLHLLMALGFLTVSITCEYFECSVRSSIFEGSHILSKLWADRDTHIDVPSFTAPEIPKGLELKNGGAPLERELEAVKKQVKELVSKARSNGDERNDFASRELELHHKEVASMQETVTALKSELRAKVRTVVKGFICPCMLLQLAFESTINIFCRTLCHTSFSRDSKLKPVEAFECRHQPFLHFHLM